MTDTTEKVIRLAEVRPNSRTIEYLEVALEKAKTGELQDFVLTGSTNDHRLWSIASFEDGIELLGHLAHQQVRVSSVMAGVHEDTTP